MKRVKRIVTCLVLVATISFTVLTPVTTLALSPPQSGTTTPPPPPPPPPPSGGLLDLILVLLGIV